MESSARSSNWYPVLWNSSLVVFRIIVFERRWYKFVKPIRLFSFGCRLPLSARFAEVLLIDLQHLVSLPVIVFFFHSSTTLLLWMWCAPLFVYFYGHRFAFSVLCFPSVMFSSSICYLISMQRLEQFGLRLVHSWLEKHSSLRTALDLEFSRRGGWLPRTTLDIHTSKNW